MTVNRSYVNIVHTPPPLRHATHQAKRPLIAVYILVQMYTPPPKPLYVPRKLVYLFVVDPIG